MKNCQTQDNQNLCVRIDAYEITNAKRNVYYVVKIIIKNAFIY